MYKISNGLSPPLVSNIFPQKIVTLTICDLIFSFPDLLLGLYFKGPKVQYLGPVIWSILPDSSKNVPNFSVFKTGLKDGNLKIFLTDFAKPLFVESVLPRLPFR